jgi:hypothetical protein
MNERSTRRALVEAGLPGTLFLSCWALYAATAAPGTLFGDPAEYQFIPAILGIAHPPGYAFYTLVAKLWQVLVPVGSVAYRTNLLAGALGAWVVTAVYLTVRDVELKLAGPGARSPGAAPLLAAPLLAALSLAAAPDVWQHAIHANAHILSAALAATHLWLLIRWWRTARDLYLLAFAVTVGWAATHHPITLMGAPAYALFVLWVRPTLLRRWRLLLALGGAFLVGLLPLLYLPLRSPSTPFGPTDMRTWEGFWRHFTARGLRVNLFHFGPEDQIDRLQVLGSLLRLQFAWSLLLLVPVGLARLARRAARPGALLGIFLVAHLGFTMNTVQDVMAYLMLPFVAVAILGGVGAALLFDRLARRTRGGWVPVLVQVALLAVPLYRGALNLERGISLRDFAAAEEWVRAVEERFVGAGEGAVLLSDWEHLTPLWVHTYTEDLRLRDEDLELVYVSTSNPWVESVWAHIERGPIYLPDPRPAVRNEGFRLVPEGAFYRVVAPPHAEAAPEQRVDAWVEDRLQIVGYELPETTVRAGEPLALVLYQRVSAPMAGIWMPYAQLGPLEARWTTDSRRLTPQWLPDEVIVSRYEIPIPFHLAPGSYPLRLGYADLSGGRPMLSFSGGGTTVPLADVEVLPPAGPRPPRLEGALANFDHQVALTGARVASGVRGRRAPWNEPLLISPGRRLHVTLNWQVLATPRDSFTIFIHLIDGAGRYVAGHDYTPLGGSCPSYLWFPKWLPGQRLTDPYQLGLPEDLPPGDYWVEVGMYGMTSLRRLPVVDLTGNLAGDRVILGPVRVQ